MAIIVIRSRTKERISGTFCFEWSVTEAIRRRSGSLIMRTYLTTRDKAKDIIKSNGLVESYSTNDGEVYDTPDGNFKALFPDGIRTKAEREMIEKLDRI